MLYQYLTMLTKYAWNVLSINNVLPIGTLKGTNDYISSVVCILVITLTRALYPTVDIIFGIDKELPCVCSAFRKVVHMQLLLLKTISLVNITAWCRMEPIDWTRNKPIHWRTYTNRNTCPSMVVLTMLWCLHLKWHVTINKEYDFHG